MPIYSIKDLSKARKLHYRTEHHGLPISIENRKGSFRHWFDHVKQKPGKTRMKHPYGYIPGTEGADGDGIDVFIGPHEHSDRVYVVNQHVAGKRGRFDEHKVMLAFRTKEEAKAAYLANYDSKGPQMMGAVRAWSMGRFRRWLREGDTKAPARKSLLVIVPSRLEKGVEGSERPGHKYIRRWKGKKGWEYEYAAPATPKAPEFAESAKSEEDYVAGNFDKDPAHWQWYYAVKGQPPIGWAEGGVAIDSKHPVKEAGAPHRLYQIVEPHADKGWARLKDVATGETKLVAHERVYPVRFGIPKEPEKPKPEAPGEAWTPGTISRPKSPTKAAAGTRTVVFADSQAKEGTALHKLEHGQFIRHEVALWEVDASGEKNRVKAERTEVDNPTKTKLLAEFKPLIYATAKELKRKYRLPSRWSVEGEGRKTDETLIDLRSAATEGFLRAVESYPGGFPFSTHAGLLTRDYARLHAGREFSGGLAMPEQHQRLLTSYITARATASAKLDTDNPTPEQVAPFWKVKRRHVHRVMPKGSLDRNEDLPLNPYKLTEDDPKSYPGKLGLAETMDSFLAGQEPSAEFVESEALALPALQMGLGLTADERVILRRSITATLAKLSEHEVSNVGATRSATYRANTAEIIRRTMGLETGEAESLSSVLKEVPIRRKEDGGWKVLSQARAMAVAQDLLSDAFGKMRVEMGDDPASTSVISRVQEKIVPAVEAESGPTFRQRFEARRRTISAAQIRAWRSNQRSMLGRIWDRLKAAMPDLSEKDKAHQQDLMDSVKAAKRRVGSLGDREVSTKIAMSQLSDMTDEIRRMQTHTVSVEVLDPKKEYGWAVVTMTDLGSGEEKRVRVRTIRDLRLSKSNADAASVPTTGVLMDLVRWPLLMSLLTHPSIPDRDRASLEQMVGFG